MHRSGTSMAAQLLYHCGLYLGEETELAPPAPDNLDGFWEHHKFVELNEEIFAYLGGGWDMPPQLPADWELDDQLQKIRIKAELLVETFRIHGAWGWKDPRNSITFPFWKSLVPNLKVVVCIRHPLEVLLSLRKRNSLSSELALALWATYNRRVLETVPRGDRLVVHYDAFFRQPETELRRMIAFSGIAPGDDRVNLALQRIRPDLRHASFDTRDLINISLSADTIRIYIALATEAGWLDGARDLADKTEGRRAARVIADDDVETAALVGPEATLAVGAGKLNRAALDLELLRRHVVEIRKELALRDSQVRDLAENLAGAENTLTSHETAIAQLQAELVHAQQVDEIHIDETQRLEIVLADVARTLSATRHAMQTYEASLANIEAAVLGNGEIQRSDTNLAEREASLRNRVANIVSALEAGRNKTASLAEGFDRMADRASVAERERSATKESLEAAERDRNATRESLESARASMDALRGHSEALKTELEEIHASRLWRLGSAYWRVLNMLRRPR